MFLVDERKPVALLGAGSEKASWELKLPSLFSSGVFLRFGGAVLNISVMSALADIADEYESLSGMRLEGILIQREHSLLKP